MLLETTSNMKNKLKRNLLFKETYY